MKAIFWFSILWILYVYIGYPVLAAVLRRFVDAKIKSDKKYEPRVSIVISAYNEESVIAETLRNKFGLDYPADKIELLIVSDESIDKTDAIVRSLALEAPFSVQLVRQVPRQGKTSGLNLLVPRATGEILVFSDANSIYERDAIRRLVENFSDECVGYVTGKMVYVNSDGSLVGDGCSSYMKYENWLREQETGIGSIVGVDGGIDAMRRNLYEPLRSDQLPDFVQPLKVVEKGYRVVYEPRAVLREHTTSSSEDEYRMRVRVTLRALWALRDMAFLLNPCRYGVFAVQMWSHKVLRYLAFGPLAMVAVASVALAGHGLAYSAALIAQIACYAAAWGGWRRRNESDSPAWLSIPYYFLLINVACASAVKSFLRGEKKVIWTPRSG
jgi:glycosyltransferase involved in cell wall biosynthesis